MTATAPSIETTRERLLDAAIGVFSERGYDGAGVQEIARRAGLTTGAIYANFRGKAHLLFEAIGARSGRELDQLLRSGDGACSAGELLAELGSHLLDDRPGARAGLLVEAIVAARRDEELAGLVRTLVDRRVRAIGRLVDLARAEGDVDDSVSADALTTFCLVLALGSLLYRGLDLEHPDGGEWSALIHRFVAALAGKEDQST